MIEDFYDMNDKFDFEENNFQIAVAVVDYDSWVPLDSPEYVRWTAVIKQKANGVKEFFPLKHHKCNEDDFEKFYSPSRRAKKAVQELKETSALYCLDA